MPSRCMTANLLGHCREYQTQTARGSWHGQCNEDRATTNLRTPSGRRQSIGAIVQDPAWVRDWQHQTRRGQTALGLLSIEALNVQAPSHLDSASPAPQLAVTRLQGCDSEMPRKEGNCFLERRKRTTGTPLDGHQAESCQVPPSITRSQHPQASGRQTSITMGSHGMSFNAEWPGFFFSFSSHASRHVISGDLPIDGPEHRRDLRSSAAHTPFGIGGRKASIKYYAGHWRLAENQKKSPSTAQLACAETAISLLAACHDLHDQPCGILLSPPPPPPPPPSPHRPIPLSSLALRWLERRPAIFPQPSLDNESIDNQQGRAFLARSVSWSG
jgi:hypothetical protein